MPTERVTTTREPATATTTSERYVTREKTGGSGMLYFIVGALVVAVGVIGYLMYEGSTTSSSRDTAIERSADAIGDAANRIGDSIDDMTTRQPQTNPQPHPVQPAQPPVEPAPVQ